MPKTINYIKLNVDSLCGMVNIESNEFSYAIIFNMYTTGDGIGCQVDNEKNRKPVEIMCKKIAYAIKEFKEGEKCN